MIYFYSIKKKIEYSLCEAYPPKEYSLRRSIPSAKLTLSPSPQVTLPYGEGSKA